MSTYKKCGSDVRDMADALISKYETHASLTDNHVEIDFLFAYGDRDDTTGELISDALKLHGVKALGIARKLPLKDRAKGMGDAEICLDGDWWEAADEKEQAALLDHELHHLVATADRDAIGRPVIKLRKHDYQFGWFSIIAQRHGVHSQERQQAAAMMEVSGQFYWPALATTAKGSRFQKLETSTA